MKNTSHTKMTGRTDMLRKLEKQFPAAVVLFLLQIWYKSSKHTFSRQKGNICSTSVESRYIRFTGPLQKFELSKLTLLGMFVKCGCEISLSILYEIAIIISTQTCTYL